MVVIKQIRLNVRLAGLIQKVKFVGPGVRIQTLRMWRRAHMAVAGCLHGEKSLAEVSLMRRAILPECPPSAPQRRQALLVRNRILDDDGLDLFGVGNCHPQSDMAAVIMEEKAIPA